MGSSAPAPAREYRLSTRLGHFLAAFRGGRLAGLALPGTWRRARRPPPLAGREGAAGRALARQLREYLAGRRRRFTVPLAASGTVWREQVWAELRRIPWGRVRTYGQVAAAAGRPGAARAAGGACGANPVVVLIPCHRVVAAGGLGGFGGGRSARAARRWLAWKRRLLEIEGRGRL